MKIVITFGAFLPVPAARGGAMEKIGFNLARRLAARGHDVTILSRTWPGWPDEEIIDGVKFIRLTGHDHYKRLWQNLWLDFRWSLRLMRKIPRDAVVVSHNVALPVLLCLPGRRHPMPVTVMLGRMPKGQIRTYGRVDRLYATSEAVAERCLHENPRVRPRLKTLPNSIDWHSFQGTNLRPPNEPMRIGFAGRIHPEKGLDLLIRAAGILHRQTDLPPWKISFIGAVKTADGGGGEAFRDSLVILAQNEGIGDHVSFLPPAWDTALLADYYRSLTLFCYPTRAEKGEGLSVAPIEAMAAGAVPVVSNLDCYRDLIIPGRNGLIFDHRHADAAEKLAAQLACLLRETEHRQALSIQARETAKAFDYDSIASALDADLRILSTAALAR